MNDQARMQSDMGKGIGFSISNIKLLSIAGFRYLYRSFNPKYLFIRLK